MKPIIFSTPMVQAILDGRKTQTRRVVKGDTTALAYREMLERARKTLQDAWEDEGSTTVGKQILETIKAIDELLKGE